MHEFSLASVAFPFACSIGWPPEANQHGYCLKVPCPPGLGTPPPIRLRRAGVACGKPLGEGRRLAMSQTNQNHPTDGRGAARPRQSSPQHAAWPAVLMDNHPLHVGVRPVPSLCVFAGVGGYHPGAERPPAGPPATNSRARSRMSAPPPSAMGQASQQLVRCQATPGRQAVPHEAPKHSARHLGHQQLALSATKGLGSGWAGRTGLLGDSGPCRVLMGNLG